MTTNNYVEEKVEELNRLEEMCDGDSDQIVAMYRRNISTTLPQLVKEVEAGEREKFATVLNDLINEPAYSIGRRLAEYRDNLTPPTSDEPLTKLTQLSQEYGLYDTTEDEQAIKESFYKLSNTDGIPNHLKQPLGFLRQWLNEDRKCSPQVTTQELWYWLKGNE